MQLRTQSLTLGVSSSWDCTYHIPVIILMAVVLALLYLNFSIAYLLGRALFKRAEEFGRYEKP